MGSEGRKWDGWLGGMGWLAAWPPGSMAGLAGWLGGQAGRLVWAGLACWPSSAVLGWVGLGWGGWVRRCWDVGLQTSSIIVITFLYLSDEL